MPRTARVAPGGMVFHVLNRGVARMQLFEKEGDFQAFERVLQDTLKLAPMRICAYCLMSNHWHFLLWPEHDRDLAAFMQRLTITHVRRWQESRRYVGLGHVYQGRYKSFPVEEDDHFLAVARYVERNPLRANLVLRGGVAMVEPLAATLWQRGGKGHFGRVAIGITEGLGGAGQPRRQREGIGGIALQRAAWTALRRIGMAGADCQASGAGISVSFGRSATDRTQRCPSHRPPMTDGPFSPFYQYRTCPVHPPSRSPPRSPPHTFELRVR